MFNPINYKASRFGKVAVLMGGESAEREISLESGRAVHSALLKTGVDSHMIDYQEDLFERFINDGHIMFFILLKLLQFKDSQNKTIL